MNKGNKGQFSKSVRYLEGANFLLGRIHQKNIVHNAVLSWRLHNFENLKSDVLYYKYYDSANVSCKLRVMKRDKSLYLCVSGRTVPKNTKAEFLIMSEESLKSVTKPGDEIVDSVFAAEFPSESFLGPDLDFLGDDGTLTVSFKFATVLSVTYQTHDREYEEETLCDLDELCCDLKNMYYEALCSDFLIHVKEHSFKTHKFMLSARSEFFEQFFKVEKHAKDYRLDFKYPGIVHEVLVYIYSAELADMDPTSLLKVYELATMLKVKSLYKRCLDYFRENVEENCRNIAKLSVKLGNADLKNIVVHHLTKDTPDFDIVGYFRGIERCRVRWTNVWN